MCQTRRRRDEDYTSNKSLPDQRDEESPNQESTNQVPLYLKLTNVSEIDGADVSRADFIEIDV